MLKFIWPGANIYVYIYLYIYTTVSIEIHCSTMPQDVCPIYHSERTRDERRGGGVEPYTEKHKQQEKVSYCKRIDSTTEESSKSYDFVYDLHINTYLILNYHTWTQ